jgi:hypothetical protein
MTVGDGLAARRRLTDNSGMGMLTRAARMAVLLLPAAVACTSDVTLVPARTPDTTGTDTTGTDTTGTDTTVVQRATLTVTTSVDPQDAALATQLGWTGGVIAGATVTARRPFLEATGTTDSLGQVRFANLLPGVWTVSVLRVLTAAERALLPPAQADLTAFGGGRDVTLAPPTTALAVTARATRRGSLVISEKFPATWLGNQSYLLGTYLEIYNNSDTTIFLDRKLFGWGPFFMVDYPQYDRPCSLTQQWQADPDGLWSVGLWRFPGTGQQYPLAPGEAAVLATDAVDHSVVDPRWPNLSTARFEFIGPSDVDNPAAANMTLVFTPWSDPLGHGPMFDSDGILFIAKDLDIDTLPTVQPPNFRLPIPRVPRAAILDVVSFMIIPSFYEQYGFQLCPILINPVFDAGPWFVVDPAVFMSLRRRALGTVLLRSGSTVNDFEIISAPTPGYVP